MKTTEGAKSNPKKPSRKGYTIKPSLKGKYDNEPYFQEKVKEANSILKKFGIPKFD